jgi:hypothetical protein
MEQKARITVQFDERGELVSVNMGGRELTEPTHDLYEKLPPGVFKGFSDMGKIYTYELADGRLGICVHRRCKLF